ncbi:hypothetical protein BaRGS_00012318 [Batillaria attramentaria]|uniref:G-protein coupled receptors family 1 profile domain-containing protein n=1 Tax=Batillaria attramentaria TaxID=370345 RepID=A0ABD0LAV2_9CAEN
MIRGHSTESPHNLTTPETDAVLFAGGSVTYFLVVLHIALSVFIVFGNTMTILAIRGTHQLQTEANLYVLHLAIADTLVGLGTFLGSFLYMDFSRKILDRSRYFCLGMVVLVCVSVCQSLGTLILLAIDRMVHVAYPFRYRRYFTERAIKRVLGVSWVLALAAGTVPFYANSFSPSIGCSVTKLMHTSFEHVFIPVAVLVASLITKTCYVTIACIACRHRRKRKPDVQQQNTPKGPQLTAGEDNRDLRRHWAKASDSKTKSVGLFLTVNSIFSLCWAPFVMVSVAVNFVDVPEVAARVAVLVAMSNSSMNFVIYAFRNKQFARAYRNLLNACFCRRG